MPPHVLIKSSFRCLELDGPDITENGSLERILQSIQSVLRQVRYVAPVRRRRCGARYPGAGSVQGAPSSSAAAAVGLREEREKERERRGEEGGEEGGEAGRGRLGRCLTLEAAAAPGSPGGCRSPRPRR